MKIKMTAIFAALLMSAGFVFAAANDLTSLLQKGLLEEEANHNYEAAMRHYQAAIDGFDQDRQLAATAVFRLGECLRKLGKTNEAVVQHERILRDFSDQTTLAGLSREYLAGKAPPVAAIGVAATSATSPEDEEVRGIREMIRNSPDLINAPSALVGITPLQSSVRAGNIAAAELLLANGANVNGTGRGMTSDGDDTPLSLAADRGNKGMIELLLGKGADVNAPDKNNRAWTPLHHAVAKGFKTTAEVLIAHKADVNARSQNGATPLFDAAELGFSAVAELLIANAANVNAALNNGETPLFAAVQNNRPEMVQLLLSNKAEVNFTNSAGVTPLFQAVRNNQPEMVQLLLAGKAEVNFKNPGGESPLYTAVQNNRPELVQLLLTNKAEVNFTNSAGDTPLILAIRNNRAEMARLLLAGKAEVNARDKYGYTPLNLAVFNGSTDLVKLLLGNKADVNAATDIGITPLLFAVARSDANSSGQPGPVMVPMPGQAPSIGPGPGGLSSPFPALGYAATNLVKVLLDNGADTQAHIKEGGGSWGPIVPGIHALDLAIEFGRSDEMELLLAGHADPNARYASADYSGTPLLWCLHWNRNLSDESAKVIKILLAHGADPNLADQSGGTPLSIMASGFFPNLGFELQRNLLQELLDHHADPNKPDNEGWPPLAHAQNDETRAVLLKAGANEDYQRLGRIFIAQKGTGSLGQEVFYKGTNSVNHYTLLETIAEAWKDNGTPVEFPDFAHVVINRLKAGGGKEEIAVNLEEILTNGDSSKDVPSEWGDVVQIPQLDHLLNEPSRPIVPAYRDALIKCLQRQVQIIVKAQTTKLMLLPPIAIYQRVGRGRGGSPPPRDADEGTPGPNPVEKTLYTFLLDEVVHQANVLLLSSDLSRVKVTRHGVEMQYNLDDLEARTGRHGGGGMGGGGRGGGGGGGGGRGGARGFGGGFASNNNPPDLWLRDGDIIEIPERDPNAPLVK